MQSRGGAFLKNPTNEFESFFRVMLLRILVCIRIDYLLVVCKLVDFLKVWFQLQCCIFVGQMVKGKKVSFALILGEMDVTRCLLETPLAL
jgi:hypothetical protein